jgi:hypothetical protein
MLGDSAEAGSATPTPLEVDPQPILVSTIAASAHRHPLPRQGDDRH